MKKNSSNYIYCDSGIAIGPILFIIAVLGILAAAIAAGSGSFNANTSMENARAKAAAIMEIGQSLKMAFERMNIGSQIAFEDINIDPADTTAVTDLFSPDGGGIPAPTVTMAFDPTVDVWHFPIMYDPKLGTLAADCPTASSNICGNRYALLRVEPEVCDEINKRAANDTITTTAGGTVLELAEDLGDFTAEAANIATPLVLDSDAWNNKSGRMTGCFYNANVTAGSTGYFFFQVLGVR